MSETCPSCSRRITTTKGRIDQHERALGWTDGVATRFAACPGSGKQTAEARASAKDKRTAKRWREIEAARPDAAVTLDAVLVGSEAMHKQLPSLLKLALAEYRLLYPLARIREIWKNVDRRHKAGMRSGRVDVYCTFCAELLAQDWARGWDSIGSIDGFKLIDGHCVPCALQHLAGMRTAEMLRTRKLPSSALASADVGELEVGR